MPLRKIKFIKNEFYHIYNCGKEKINIFCDDNDRYRFIQTMYLSNNSFSFRGLFGSEKNIKKYPLDEIKKIIKSNNLSINPLVEIYGFCLMPDHYHLLLRNIREKGISRFMQKLGNSYGKYFSNKYGQLGSLFQGRFKAVPLIHKKQLKYLLTYINVINPAQIVEPYLKIKGVENFNMVWNKVENYAWSSHQEYMNRRSLIIINKKLKFFSVSRKYQEFVKRILLSRKNEIWKTIEKLTID